MFSQRYEIVGKEVSEFSHTRPEPLDSLRPMVASDYAPFFWSEGFGLGGELDQAIIARSAEVKAGVYGGRVSVIVPIYVTSICEEQCVSEGLGPVFNWRAEDLSSDYRPDAAVCGGAEKR